MELDDLGLSPLGFELTDLALTPALAVARLASTAATADCPACGATSRRVHSRYTCTVADLPGHGRRVALRLAVRRFRCGSPGCPRAVFCERVGGVAGPHARSTARLTGLHRLVGLALGGEPGSRLAGELAVPTSADTLLRRVKDAEVEPAPPARFVGIDDFAFRRVQTYGTVVVDLERGRVIDLLPDREAATVEAWLKAHPGAEAVTRDRSGAYAKGVSDGAPGAVQVANRWHLLKNQREAVECLFDRLAGAIDAALHEEPPKPTPEPTPPPAAPDAPSAPPEPKPDPRRAAFDRARELAARGVPVLEIAARVGLARNTVRRYLRTGRLPDRRRGRPAAGKLSAHAAWIDRRIAGGVASAARLHRELIELGVRASPATVRRAVAARLAAAGQQRRPGRPTPAPPAPTPRRLSFDWVRRPERRDPDAHGPQHQECGRTVKVTR